MKRKGDEIREAIKRRFIQNEVPEFSNEVEVETTPPEEVNTETPLMDDDGWITIPRKSLGLSPVEQNGKYDEVEIIDDGGTTDDVIIIDEIRRPDTVNQLGGAVAHDHSYATPTASGKTFRFMHFIG